MSTTLISPGPVTPLVQNVVYALPASPCIITGANLQKSLVYEGPFSDWAGGYHVGGGHTKCITGNTTIQAEKVKMTGPYSKGSYSLAVLNSGASNYWRLGESSGLVAVDSIGGANGTISGGVTLNTSGALSDGNKAMTFDGTTGKVVTAATVTIPLVVTFEAWIKLPLTSSATRVMLGLTSYQFMFALSNRYIMSYGGTPVSVTSVPVRPTDELWHHAVLIHDGVTATFYLDGVFAAAVAQTRSALTLITGIGASPNGDNFFIGSLDEVAIYPRALTAQEIMSHYAARTKR